MAGGPFAAIFEKRLNIIYIYTNNATLRYNTEALLFFFYPDDFILYEYPVCDKGNIRADEG